jgi:hypothetical protein
VDKWKAILEQRDLVVGERNRRWERPSGELMILARFESSRLRTRTRQLVTRLDRFGKKIVFVRAECNAYHAVQLLDGLDCVMTAQENCLMSLADLRPVTLEVLGAKHG